MENEEAPALDSQWYDELEKHGSFEPYDYLGGDAEERKRAQEAFLQKGEGPILDYPKIKLDDLNAKKQGLLALLERIEAKEENEAVKALYREKIEEKLAGIALLRAVRQGDAETFSEKGKEIYGELEEGLFYEALSEMQALVERGLSAESEETRSTAMALNDLLPTLPEGFRHLEKPSSELVQEVQGIIQGRVSQLLHGSKEEIDPDKEYEVEAIKGFFEIALKNLGVEDWTIKLTNTRTSIHVSQERKCVEIPSSRKVKGLKLTQLIMHEIGTHVARRKSGEESSLKMLGLGTAGYERIEEGIATFCEQAIAGKVSFYQGWEAYLAIGLALGVDSKERNFKEVFDIFVAYKKLKAHLEGKSLSQEAAEKGTCSSLVRYFRGTPNGNLKGVAFLKDIIYFLGNVKIWAHVMEEGSQVVHGFFDRGKTDPTNEEQIQQVEAVLSPPVPVAVPFTV